MKLYLYKCLLNRPVLARGAQFVTLCSTPSANLKSSRHHASGAFFASSLVLAFYIRGHGRASCMSLDAPATDCDSEDLVASRGLLSLL